MLADTWARLLVRAEGSLLCALLEGEHTHRIKLWDEPRTDPRAAGRLMGRWREALSASQVQGS